MREYVDENNKYPDGEVKYHVGIDAGADRGRLDYSKRCKLRGRDENGV